MVTLIKKDLQARTTEVISLRQENQNLKDEISKLKFGGTAKRVRFKDTPFNSPDELYLSYKTLKSQLEESQVEVEELKAKLVAR